MTADKQEDQAEEEVPPITKEGAMAAVLLAEADFLEREAASKRARAHELCPHPNQKIASIGRERNEIDDWVEVDHMVCPDCGHRWTKPN